MVAGATTAAMTAAVAVWLVLSVRRRSFASFVVHRVAAGVVVRALVAGGVR